MAESLLMPLVNSLLRKATDAAVQQFGEMCGIDKKRKRLHRHLLAVQRILVDAEHRAEREPDVKAWMHELKEAAYKAEDVLDELEYSALRQKAEAARGSMVHKVKDFFTSENPAVFRLTMSKKISDVLREIDEIVSEMNKFNFTVHTEPQPVARARPQTMSFVDADEVIGRDRDKEKIVDMLLSQRDNHSVAVLPIVGMGGLGKTTLMQLVYNDDRVKQHFELLVWVCVSDDMTTTSVAKSIIEDITKQSCLVNNAELLQQQLRDALGRRRYLLALDDVWNEEREKWEELKALLSSARVSGRVIMVTSRSDRVASIMGTLITYRLGYLDHDDSWDVFQRRAFSMGVEQQPELVAIGKRIVKKCAGVPLAVKTMGSLMSTKYEEDQWCTVLESEVWGNIFDEKGIKRVLKLSYDHLPPYMKQCFAFCALFPKDHLFCKDLLIQLWMANGFVPLEGSVNLDDKGSQIFYELTWRSFFQDVNEAESFDKMLSFDYYYRHKVTTFKMHDLMHDLAVSIMDKECHIVRQTDSMSIPPEVHHLYVTPSSRLKAKKGHCSIRTLLLLWPSNMATTWHHDVLKSAHVRVLDTLLAKSFPAGIPYMKHVRYLDLSSSWMQSLPEDITTLYHLQTLKLGRCRFLHQLPEGMRHMSSLRHLFLIGCCRLKCMPTGIGQLTSLQTLTDFVVDDATGRGIEELKCLKLVGELHLHNLWKVKDGVHAKEADLISKRKINSLMLCWGPQKVWRMKDNGNVEEIAVREFLLAPISDNGLEVLEALAPHCGLEVLEVSRYPGIEFSLWMKDTTKLQNLTKLYLKNCKHCMELPPVWQLPSLEFLLLENMDSLTHVCNINGFYEEGNNHLQVFPALKILQLFLMPNLEHWDGNNANQGRSLTFLELVEMEINWCPKLENMPVVPQLRKLKIIGQNKMALTSVSSLRTLTELAITTSNSSGHESSPLDHVISYKGLDSLHTLELDGFNSPMRIEEEENEHQNTDHKPVMVECEENDHKNKSVRTLGISSCDSFFTSEISGKGLRFWRSFVSLEKLEITLCDNLVHWPVEEFQGLNCLKSLNISFCKNLTGCSPGTSYASSEQDLLPQLEELWISNCHSLQEIPVCSASLKTIYLSYSPILSCLPERLGALTALENIYLHSCEGLTCLMSSLGNLVQLKSLIVDGCPKLSALPDGMECLTALRNLHISHCPRIKSLPHGLLRLRNLERLKLENCPSLQKRCRREEEYRDFVSHIRDVDLLDEDNSKGWSWPFPKMRDNGCEGIRCIPGL